MANCAAVNAMPSCQQSLQGTLSDGKVIALDDMIAPSCFIEFIRINALRSQLFFHFFTQFAIHSGLQLVVSMSQADMLLNDRNRKRGMSYSGYLLFRKTVDFGDLLQNEAYAFKAFVI